MMPAPTHVAVATFDHGEDKLATVSSQEFYDLKDAIAWTVQMAKAHGVSGDKSVSYIEVTAMDPDEDFYLFCSTEPDELNALVDDFSVS